MQGGRAPAAVSGITLAFTGVLSLDPSSPDDQQNPPSELDDERPVIKNNDDGSDKDLQSLKYMVYRQSPDMRRMEVVSLCEVGKRVSVGWGGFGGERDSIRNVCKQQVATGLTGGSRNDIKLAQHEAVNMIYYL